VLADERFDVCLNAVVTDGAAVRTEIVGVAFAGAVGFVAFVKHDFDLSVGREVFSDQRTEIEISQGKGIADENQFCGFRKLGGCLVPNVAVVEGVEYLLEGGENDSGLQFDLGMPASPAWVLFQGDLALPIHVESFALRADQPVE
jgi:hypothetical protein